MFYDLSSVCQELTIKNTFNEGNPDYGYFNTWKWRKLIIAIINVTHATPKLANLRPILQGFEKNNNGLSIITTNDSYGIVTLIEIKHNDKRVNFKFKR